MGVIFASGIRDNLVSENKKRREGVRELHNSNCTDETGDGCDLRDSGSNDERWSKKVGCGYKCDVWYEPIDQ